MTVPHAPGTFTLDDLRRILVAVAGQDEAGELDGDIGDIPFDELGYDSLARMELAAQIAGEYGIELDDDASTGVDTPNGMVELVRLAAAGAASAT